MNEINEAIKKVHETITQHKGEASIDKIEKKVEDVVNKVVYNRLQNFASYVGRYTDDNGGTSENTGHSNGISAVRTTDDHELHHEEESNLIIHSQTQSQVETITYVLPETFPNVASILDHWGTYISENESRYGFRWRKGWN